MSVLTIVTDGLLMMVLFLLLRGGAAAPWSDRLSRAFQRKRELARASVIARLRPFEEVDVEQVTTGQIWRHALRDTANTEIELRSGSSALRLSRLEGGRMVAASVECIEIRIGGGPDPESPPPRDLGAGAPRWIVRIRSAASDSADRTPA